MKNFGSIACQRFADGQARAHLRAWLAVLMMLAVSLAFAAEDFAYPYASNDGVAPSWEIPEQGYANRWTRSSQPWLREQAEPPRRAAEPWSDYSETPDTRQGGNNGSRYAGPPDGWSSSPDRARSPTDWAEPRYHEPYADGMPDNRRSGRPPFRGQSSDYGDERSAPPADPWVDGWSDDADGPSPQWYGGEDWRQNRYAEQPVTRGRRDAWNQEVTPGGYSDRSRDPWDASYTPEWGTENSSSYDDPDPFDPWAGPEVDRDNRGWEEEERPWARRRSPPPESARSLRDETRRRDQRMPPDAASRYGEGVGPYGSNWYYPGLYGFPPPGGLPGPGPMSGLAAWERLLWGAGWPAMLW